MKIRTSGNVLLRAASALAVGICLLGVAACGDSAADKSQGGGVSSTAPAPAAPAVPAAGPGPVSSAAPVSSVAPAPIATTTVDAPAPPPLPTTVVEAPVPQPVAPAPQPAPQPKPAPPTLNAPGFEPRAGY
ncbi:hypothetical protein [Nocardia sp. alder85J]|uniref:hypothetical protein n=1 Tax=Nocardia sp. alder85J TaxID=2862949 RepID=UPI001CD5B8A5|nr:hypothetical protein [Nocardia sp. alder85J]MCX4099042.1 hypothetical protein [Nocardia sp. alder85J]